MNWHPSEYQLQDLLDDQLPREELMGVRQHVQGCAACQSKLASTDALLCELRELPTEATKLPKPWNAPGWGGAFRYLPWSRVAVATAAAVIFTLGLFAGLGAGRLLIARGRTAELSREELSEQIQHSGTQYVAAIAKWRREKSVATDAEGQEVALATLYGAAYELKKLRPQNQQLANVVRSIGDLRDQAQAER